LNSAFATTGTTVTVTAPSRLHLGFLDLNGGVGRRFGSIGLAISGPRTRLSMAFASQTHIGGLESERVCRYVETMRDVLDVSHAYDVRVDEAIPRHAGLGSGTRLALAVAAGMRRLHGLPLDLRGDAIRLGRGARSGAGIGLFERGGLVVDGGRGTTPVPAPVISRLPFPDRWRVLLVLDLHRQGVHGTDETSAFAHLPPASDADASYLCRVLVMKLLPAVAEADLPAFGSAVAGMQERLGDYFASAQGGRRFVSSHVAAALDLLQLAGAVGIGQSSWGPTGYAFAPTAEAAGQMLEAARSRLAGDSVDILICKGLNGGADIIAHAPADAPPS